MRIISKGEFWIEFIAVVIAVLLLPFYIGYIHIGLPGALLYTAAAGAGLALGEELQFSSYRLSQLPDLPDLPDLAGEIAPWSVSVAVVGGIIYLLALILV